MKYHIIITPEAETDLKDAYQWYEEKAAGLGVDFLDRVDDAIQLIQENPNAYQVIHKNIRRALTHRFPYGLFFITEEEKVIVIAALHTKRNPTIWKNRQTY